MSTLKELNDHDFADAVVKAPGTVIVDFWAPWCQPCRQVSPILEDIAAAHPNITFAKINTDDNPQVASRYSVTGLPTIAVFTGGDLVKAVVGAKPKAMLLRELDQWLN